MLRRIASTRRAKSSLGRFSPPARNHIQVVGVPERFIRPNGHPIDKNDSHQSNIVGELDREGPNDQKLQFNATKC